MPRFTIMLVILVIVAGLYGCNAQPETAAPTALPTETPQPSASATTEPTATDTAMPTTTPTKRPSATPTEEITIGLLSGERYIVHEGGYSFIELLELYIEPQLGGNVIIDDTQQRVMMTLSGAQNSDGASCQALLDEVLEQLATRDKKFESGKAAPIQVGSESGLAADISGDVYGQAYTGRVVIATPGSQKFAIIAISFGSDGSRWQGAGEPALNAILASLEFFQPQAAVNGCPTSTNATYGYSKDNPIQVGGDFMSGPRREKEYLGVLRGPAGQAVQYERTGSEPYGDTILDIYSLWYEGIPAVVTVYLDEYTYDTPVAPLGFTCSGPVPFGAPD